MKEIPNCQNESKVRNTQCGNQRIFLSLRFLREINFGVLGAPLAVELDFG